jgi:hypothetical protein
MQSKDPLFARPAEGLYRSFYNEAKEEVVAQFAFITLGVIPKPRAFYQRGEGSPALPAPCVSQNAPLPKKTQTLHYSVLLNNGIAIASVTVPKIARNAMSPHTAARVVSFSNRHLNPSTAYVKGST